MQNTLKKYPLPRIILIIWIVFASLYVAYGEYKRLTVYVAQTSYTRGVTDSVAKLMQESQKCQPIPVTAGDQKIELIALNCLKAPDDSAAE